MEYGRREVSRYDYRITHLIYSTPPRSHVGVVGRALRPRQEHSDFLSLRIGTDRSKYFELSVERVFELHISADAKVQKSHRKITQQEFMTQWDDVLKASLTDTNFTIRDGILTIATQLKS